MSILDHIDELIKVYCRIYSAACKYTFYYEKRDQNHTYRVDRMNTLDFLQHGQMYSFMSTSGNTNSSKGFAKDKSEVLLLEIDAPAGVEHVDLNEVLEEESVYPGEEEILYAPFVFLDKEELQMNTAELSYLDMNGNPPKAKYLLHLRLSSVNPEKIEPDRRLQMLRGEAGAYMTKTDKKRLWYKGWMKVANISLSVLYPLAALMLALGFIEDDETHLSEAG